MNDTGTPVFDGFSEQSASRRPGFPVDPYRLQRALLGGKRWLIAAGVIGVLVGGLVAKVAMSSSYESTAVLQYEGDIQLAGMPPSNNSLGPAADALRRQSVLLKIIEETGFEGSPTALARTMGYEVDLMSRTLRITVSGDTAEDAAKFARIVTNVFTTYHQERQSRRIEDEINRGRKRIEASERELEVARRRYDEFRQEHGIADLSAEHISMLESKAKLRADKELAMVEIHELEAQVKSLEAHLAATPKTNVFSAGSSPERAAYDRLRQELVDANASLSPDHPRVRALQEQVSRLGSQLRSGGGAASSSGERVAANATYQIVEEQLLTARSQLAASRERHKGLSEMADNARDRVEDFSAVEGEASALLAEVQVHEALITGLRRTEASLQDALRDPPSGFVVLDPGAVPEYPVRNKAKIVVFMAIPMLSVAIALLLVLRRELRGLCVQTVAEVAFWGNGPVLGATPWPNDPQGLDELVAGLDDVVPEATGRLLIIGASPDEARLAQELSERMNDDWAITESGAERRDSPDPKRKEKTPLQTPPPSGPYPIGRGGPQSVALVRRPPEPVAQSLRLLDRPDTLRLEAWEGPYEGQALRRAARLADRIIVLVRSGAMSAIHLNQIHNRVGRGRGIGYIVVGLPDELRKLPDRAGNVVAFWRA